MRYLIGVIIFVLGIVLVVYRERVKYFTGDFAFAEKWFGQGGTYTFLLIAGLCISIGALLFMTGALQSMFFTIFAPLFPGTN